MDVIEHTTPEQIAAFWMEWFSIKRVDYDPTDLPIALLKRQAE